MEMEKEFQWEKLILRKIFEIKYFLGYILFQICLLY